MKAMLSLGKAVKMLLKRTDVIMVSFEEAMSRLEKAKKVVVTGTPIRKVKELNLAEKIKIKEKYGLNPAKLTVLAFGGSQGAKAINDTIVSIAQKKLNKNYQILLSAGQKQYEIVKENLKGKGLDIDKLDGIKIVPYMYDLQEMMSASEILIARSGAITITEIAALGKPSILVPLPNVSHNHQQYNAEVLANAGAAKIIQNDELTGERLNNEIQEMINKGNLEEMGKNAKKVWIQNSQDKIYKEIKNLVSLRKIK